MLPAFDFSGWTATLARKLLYAWVRPTVLPQRIADIALDRDKPVCYVVQDRRLSNILVLIEETRRAGLPPAMDPLPVAGVTSRHAFFFLTRRQRLAAAARDRYGHSPLLVDLADAARLDPGLDVQLVPVTILWGRSPHSQDSILKALFAEGWRPPGHLRQLIAILLHGRHVLVRFDTPISLRAFLGEGSDQERTLRKLARVLRVHFRRQRLAAIGPDLSHRNTQVDALLAAHGVRQAIGSEAERSGKSPAEATALARRFALEIASDYSYGVIRAMELFLEWLWLHLYDGIEVDGFDGLERMARDSTLVYLPCHRSHIDYLLLSFILYRRGLTPPHIAAGANLNLPLLGPLLRRGGAFFLRRSFKDQPLYGAVFDEYLHLLISRGFPVEYFIEGGRSRSGRTLAPRTGLLGMTVRSFMRDHSRPLYFIPVYVGYEKLIEGDSFVNELEGRPKRGESIWGLLGMIRRIRREFGKVHVRFGEPLNLGAFLDECQPGWADLPAGGERPAWVSGAIRSIGDEAARRINAAAVVNPVNLIGLALLAAPKHCLDEAVCHRLIDHYRALAPEQAQALPAADVAAYGVRLGLLEPVRHPLGDLLRVAPGQGALLAYFRNNVLHLFALPALVACLLVQNVCIERRRFEAAMAGIGTLLGRGFFLDTRPDRLSGMVARAVAVLADRGLLRIDGSNLSAPEPNSSEWAELRLIAEGIRPTLERHFLIFALLQRSGPGRMTRPDLEQASHLLAQRLALVYENNAVEFAERSACSQAIGNLIDLRLLSVNGDGRLDFDESITAPVAHAELLLPAELQQAVRRATATYDPAGAAGTKT
jgi:glycerol-3-phosphate O-acyltransferase